MSPLPSFAADAVQSIAPANDRSTTDILWSCLAVVFSCTWVAIHPNIPPRHIRPSRWKMLWRRTLLMLWTILVPELMVLWAVRQWFDADKVVRDRVASLNVGDEEQRKIVGGEVDDVNKGWTRMHGFFMVMGGCSVLIDGKPTRPHSKEYSRVITRISSLDVNNPVITWPVLRAEEIEDKSKGDALAKLLAFSQVAWFTLQLVTRFSSHLAFSALEIVTLSYASISALLYFFWWDKPLDVQQPIAEEASDLPSSPFIFAWRRIISGPALFHIHAMVIEEPIEPFKDNPLVNVQLDRATRRDKMSLALCGISSGLFGAIHCIAWHSSFPTSAERLMWRVSSTLVTAIPITWFLLISATFFLIRKEVGYWPVYVLRILTPTGLCMYFLARLILIIEAFVLLRSLTPDVYLVVNWTTFIPHE